MLERSGQLRKIGKEQEILRNLEAERGRQINRFMMLDFHKELRMGKSEYFTSFPFFSEQPESYKERFDVPLVIDPRISPKRQCRRAGILDHVDTDCVTNTTIVPDKPYAIWTHDAQRSRLYTPGKGMNLKEDEVRSPLIEVITLYILHPEFFEQHGVIALGSVCEDGYTPFLDIIRGKPRIYSSRGGRRNERWGALTRGKEIRVG